MRMGQSAGEGVTGGTAFPNSTSPARVTDTAEEGFFTVDHDLRIVYVEATPNGRLWTAPPRNGSAGTPSWAGMNLWEVFSGTLRPSLFAAYKHLLKGNSNAAWDANLGDLCYVFRTFAVADGFATYYRAFRKEALPAHDDRADTVVGPVVENQADSNAFFFHSADIMCVFDENGTFERLNPAAERLFGKDSGPVRRTFFSYIHPDDRENAQRLLFPPRALSAQKESESFALLCRCENLDGEYRWLQWSIALPNPRQKRFFATARDVTQIKNREEEITRQAQHDPLTGLPNRILLNERLRFCLAAAGRRRHSVAVLFLDLDRFKKINDTFGHTAGDRLLSNIAERMRSCLRDEDMVARLHGDEFVVILPQVRDARDAIRVAEKLLSRFVQPFDLNGNQLMLTVSIGISLFPQDGQTPDDLITRADDAMYRAKGSGRGCYSLYDPTIAKPAPSPVNSVEQFTLEARLSQAIQKEELLLHYQPQFDIKRGRVIGVEALMRWHPSEHERISPATVIPLAEETNLIVPLGTWAVHEACRQAVDWYRNGYPVQMSVNLSAAQLTDLQFPDKLNDYLNHVGLPPGLMDLELTERTLVQHDEKIIEVLKRLRDLGIHLSVDDFGTKYSWLPYLRNFPIDGVKVDRTFVMSVAENRADEALVRAIINLSHTLGLKVIAEGVETPAQRDTLLKMGCDVMQGHLFSAALPPSEVAPMLRQGRH
ncbi:MAG: EAL domain-containing protein [Capsulimonadales bacterium]|nr:EAL domain-containing protein [Capsulimonadales bacterium]